MNWQGIMDDLSVALIMMIVAAILGGLIVWIIKQWGYRTLKARYDQKVGEYSDLSNQHTLLMGKNKDLSAKYDDISTKYLELEDKFAIQKKQLAECSSRRTELESEVNLLAPFRRKYEEVSAMYENAVKETDDLKLQVKSLEVKHEGAQSALKSEFEENKKLRAELLHFQAAELKSKETEAKPKGTKEKEADALERIRARAQEVNFDRIGLASAADKDDLKLIKGIGPFIEKKLNSIGIYTFLQISNFTPEDEDKVNEVIEFFPGRIRRDEWSKQAIEFDKAKKNKK
ncbi:MAG: hypothetical protein SF052_20740 [Bacteroidia bacterium]|nr:hypothetical protein [Bacteroidia bacterium]